MRLLSERKACQTIFAFLDQAVIVLTLLALVLTVAGAVLLPVTASPAYYAAEYARADTLPKLAHSFRDPDGGVHRIEYTAEELDAVTGSLIRYLLYGGKTLQVTVERDGEVYEVFSEQALRHMADVKKLYAGGVAVLTGTAIALVLCAGYFVWRRKHITRKWFRTTLIVYAAVLGLLSLIVLFVLIDWNDAFVLFHRLIFPSEAQFRDAFFAVKSNYPEKYYIDNQFLVKMLDPGLFRDAGLLVAGAEALVLTTYTLIARRFSRRKERPDA
ncbi:MAG: DUF1461 domain-containing protein [Eubacteriales bacterium]|nr:DUF1461 domain-containing protein [Eubacteriales bacterium]